MKHPLPPNYPAADSVRRILFSGISAENVTFGSMNSSINVKSSIMNDSEIGIGHKICSCLSQLEQICIGQVEMIIFIANPSIQSGYG
jgi:hypothetical protein